MVQAIGVFFFFLLEFILYIRKFLCHEDQIYYASSSRVSKLSLQQNMWEFAFYSHAENTCMTTWSLKGQFFYPIKVVLTMPLCIAGITSGTWAVMYICAKGIDLASVSRIIRIDFRTVLTVLYFLFVNNLIYVKNVSL